MANFIGAIERFNPYIQQIPTEAYTKVGMYKEQQYQAGAQKIQDTIDHIAGLDIANEGGRQYLKARVDELTKSLNKFSRVDFSNPDNVSQLVGLAKPLYQDENIVNDVVNTGIYRKWAKDASEAFQNKGMELGQYARESAEASAWLSSDAAGAKYTGRQVPNTATKKDLLDRIIKAKRDGMDKSEYVYDIGYDKDKPYYIKSTDKHYSEAEFNNFVSTAVMTDKDREMLMNEHWYENQGVSPETLQKEDIAMYQSKIKANNDQIEHLTGLAALKTGDDKLRMESTITELQNYNKELLNGKIKYLQELNLADPSTRDVFHRDLGEARYMQSLDVLTDEVKKEEYVKNEQWFEDYKAALEAAKAAKAGKDTKTKAPGEPTDEVSLYTPVDPNAPKTELSLNTVQRGWQIKNDEINNAMNSLIGKLQQNGIDVSQYLAKNADGSDAWDQVQVGTKGGASMNIPRFKDDASKQKFYKLVAGLNFAYKTEAEDYNTDNQSFTKWIKENFTDYKDEDKNSKFNLSDKIVSDALNNMKGTTALLPRLEKLFADKSVVKVLGQIDAALKNKKDMANVYREALHKSGALTTDEVKALKDMSDEDLMADQLIIDKGDVTKRARTDGKYKELGDVGIVAEANGTYSIGDVFLPVVNGKAINTQDGREWYQKSGSEMFNDVPAPRYDKRYKTGFKTREEAEKYLNGEYTLSDGKSGGATKVGNKLVLGGVKGISSKSLSRAEEYVRQTYSYVQENLNTTVTNLKENEPAYRAVKDGLALFMNRAKLQAGVEDIQIDGNIDPTKISGITNVEVLGASVNNSEDIFNPNPVYEVTFEASVPDSKGELKKTTLFGKVSLKSFLATNPNYKTSEYAKYFAPFLYADKDAYARIKSAINPIEGSEGSYDNRKDIRPVYNRESAKGGREWVYDDPTPESAQDQGSLTGDTGRKAYGNDYQWETIPIDKDGKQTVISYQIVSLGQNTNLGNSKNKDGQQYEPGAFYIKMKVPTSSGQSKIIFLKKESGESWAFNSASYAHYMVRDLIFNNPDVKMDEIDASTGKPNYMTTNPATIRGILNSQLSLNGYSKLEIEKIKDALGKEQEKQLAKQLQFTNQ